MFILTYVYFIALILQNILEQIIQTFLNLKK